MAGFCGVTLSRWVRIPDVSRDIRRLNLKGFNVLSWTSFFDSAEPISQLRSATDPKTKTLDYTAVDAPKTLMLTPFAIASGVPRGGLGCSNPPPPKF